jgi:hypothetical protein
MAAAAGLSVALETAMSEYTTCRRCQTPIFFARTQRGRLIPVDATPAPEGKLRRTPTGVVFLASKAIATAKMNREPLYVCHLSYCKPRRPT